MHGARRLDNLKEVIAVIDPIHPLEMVAQNGMTPLLQAIDFQDSDVVAAFLEAKSRLAWSRMRSLRNLSVYNLPIHFASQIAAGCDTPEALLIPQLITRYSQGSALLPRDSSGRTPLQLAVTGPSSIVAEWLLKEGPNLPKVEDSSRRTPLHYCASTANIDLLLGNDADINHTDKSGFTALHQASFLGQPELVKCLLRHKPGLYLQNNRYGTALHCGVISGSSEVVLALLDAGAPPNAVDLRGNTALHVAARMDRHRIFRILIDRGADIDALNHNGKSLRNIAVMSGQLGSVGVLSILERGHQNRVDAAILQTDPRGHHTGQVQEKLKPDFLWEEPTLEMTLRSQTKPDHEVWSENFSIREMKLTRYEDAYTKIWKSNFPQLMDNHWAVTKLMELIWVFFDDTSWQPPLLFNMIEIMTVTAYDLAELLLAANTLTLLYHQILRSEDEEEKIRRSNVGEMSSPTSDLLEHFGNVITGKKKYYFAMKEADAHPYSLQGDQIQFLAKAALQNATYKQEKRASFEFTAALCIAEIVAVVKPPSVLPERTETSLQHMILWELKRLSEGRTIRTVGLIPVGCTRILPNKFPLVSSQRRGVAEYKTWRDAKRRAASDALDPNPAKLQLRLRREQEERKWY